MEQKDELYVITLPDDSKKETLIDGNRIARLGDRLLALIFDTIVIAAALALIGVLIASQSGGFTEKGFSLEGTPALLTIGSTMLFALLYHWLFEGLWGATLGKAIIGIKVVDKSGSKCNLKSAFIRNLCRIIDGIAVYLVGFFVAIFSKLRQRVGDHLANTVVIEIKPKKLTRVISILVWFAVIAVSIFFSLKIYSQFNETSLQSDTSIEDEVNFTEGDLRVINFNFIEPKDESPRDNKTFKAGEKIFTSYDIIGYTTDSDGKYELTVNVTVHDPEGLIVVSPWKGEVKEYPEKLASPVNGTFNFDLPHYCSSGEYKIKISVHDAVKRKDIEELKTFNVQAENIPIAENLEFRDFYFSKSEDGEQINPAVISPGETIYSGCKIAGMKFSEDQ
ncbi:MAG: RDD family protein, partial [Geobacter sp.]